MSHLYFVLLVARVMLLVYWLGPDLGVFYSAGFLADPDLPPASRAAVVKVLHWLDLWPRVALILMFPLGATLALMAGYAELPNGMTPVALSLLWIFAAVWLAMAVTIHMKGNKTLVPIDLGVRIGAIIGLIILSTSSFMGHGPVVAGAHWLAAKLAVFAYVILCGLGIRIAFRPFGPAFAALMREGSTPRTESELRRAVVQARIPALALWAGVFVEAVLGLTKPF